MSFNLKSVYRPAIRTALGEQAPGRDERRSTKLPVITWQEARELGRHAMAAQASTLGFTVLEESAIVFDAASDAYVYTARSSLDVNRKEGATRVTLDARTGRMRALWLPPGSATGDTITTWIGTLHVAAIGGVPFRIAMTAMGGTVTMLSVTGLLM